MNQWFSDVQGFILKCTTQCKACFYKTLISLNRDDQHTQRKYLYRLLNTYPYNSQEHQHVEKRLAEVEARLGMRPPIDPANREGWDYYWQTQINEREKPRGLTHYFEVTKPLMPIIHKLEYTTALSVGCGISLEVRGFAAGGLHAIGIDFSRVAIEYATNCTLFEMYQDQYLEQHEHRPHGDVEFIVGNFLDPTICRGPFDVIVSRGTIQYFHRLNMLDTALQALVNRLSPRGMLVIGTHGDVPAMEPITNWLQDHQFTVYFREHQQDFMRSHPGTRAAWHAMSTG